MHVLMNQYENADYLGEMILHRDKEVRELISGVPGFVAYYATRNGDQVTTITICADEAGTLESTARMREWVRRTMGEGRVAPPVVTTGETFVQF